MISIRSALFAGALVIGSVAYAEGYDYTVDVHGGVIRDDATKSIGIVFNGGEDDLPISLEKDITRVKSITQDQYAADALIAIGEGQTLSLQMAMMANGVRPLAFGAFPGVGRLSPLLDRMEFDTGVTGPSTGITVNANLEMPGKTFAKFGVGKVAIAGNFSAIVEQNAGSMVYTNLGGNSALTIVGDGAVYDYSSTTAADFPELVSTMTELQGEEVVVSSQRVVPIQDFLVGEGNVVRIENAHLAKYSSNGSGVGIASDGGIGLLKIVGDSLLESAITIAGSNGYGAIYQKSGVVNNSIASKAVIVANQGYGYYELETGEYQQVNDAIVGRNGQGVFAQYGGVAAQQSGSFILGALGGCGVFYQGAGQFSQLNSQGNIQLGNGESGGFGSWTIDGPEAITEVGNAINGGRFVLANATDESEWVLNVNNGGELRCESVVCAKTRDGDAKGYVNFNGGVLCKDFVSGPIFGNSSEYDPVDRVTLFKGGMTVRAEVDECSLDVPINAPSGLGVVEIPWSDVTTKFLGSPVVKIVGDGYGATAYADFDSESRTVTGIRITSPGCDYTHATAQVYYGTSGEGTHTLFTEIECELGEQESGGITKTGPGTLVLNGKNTYTGPTVISEGIVKLGGNDVLGPGSALVMNGGIIDLNDSRQVFAGFSGDSTTSIINSAGEDRTIHLSGLVIDMDEIRAGKVATNDFANVVFEPNATIKLRHAEDGNMDQNAKYTLMKFVGESIPKSLPEMDESVYKKLDTGWRILVTEDSAVLRHVDGSIYIFY